MVFYFESEKTDVKNFESMAILRNSRYSHRSGLNLEQFARTVLEALKNFHLNTLLFSKTDHFSFRCLFVCILEIRYLEREARAYEST